MSTHGRPTSAAPLARGSTGAVRWCGSPIDIRLIDVEQFIPAPSAREAAIVAASVETPDGVQLVRVDSSNGAG
jgi:hypothetical protein